MAICFALKLSFSHKKLYLRFHCFSLIRDYKRAVSIGKKNIDSSLSIVALYIKAFGPYPKHLEISYCTCNFLKASLLCKCLIHANLLTCLTLNLRTILIGLKATDLGLKTIHSMVVSIGKKPLLLASAS